MVGAVGALAGSPPDQDSIPGLLMTAWMIPRRPLGFSGTFSSSVLGSREVQSMGS